MRLNWWASKKCMFRRAFFNIGVWDFLNFRCPFLRMRSKKARKNMQSFRYFFTLMKKHMKSNLKKSLKVLKIPFLPKKIQKKNCKKLFEKWIKKCDPKWNLRPSHSFPFFCFASSSLSPSRNSLRNCWVVKLLISRLNYTFYDSENFTVFFS